MPHSNDALRTGPSQSRTPPARTAIVIGAGGALGSAVLEAALGSGVFERARVLVDAPVTPAMRGFEPLLRRALEAPVDALGADTGFVVFDRQRHAHGREDAFHRPSPHELPALARALQAGHVRRLLVVLPHAPALLPQALKLGLASLDEQAVAALDFEQLVIVRSAQAASTGTKGALPYRVAALMLAQLRWMIPQREQPVRAAMVARLVVELARQLPDAGPGTRIVPPELVWQTAQRNDTAALVQRWLRDGSVPAGPQPRVRW